MPKKHRGVTDADRKRIIDKFSKQENYIKTARQLGINAKTAAEIIQRNNNHPPHHHHHHHGGDHPKKVNRKSEKKKKKLTSEVFNTFLMSHIYLFKERQPKISKK